MQKESYQKRFTLLLALVFLVGLFLVAWPIAKELSAYQADEDEYEAMEDAYEAVKSKMEEWEYDCEQAVFLIKLKCDGSLLDEIDGVELEASL